MANDKTFKVKNGLLAQRYLQSAGNETAGSTASFSSGTYTGKSFNLATQATTAARMFVKTDGTKVYIASSTSAKTIYEYSLSTAWDLSTMVYASKSYTMAEVNSTVGLSFSSDGTAMYGASNTNYIYQYTLSTAWDVSTASYSSKFKSGFNATLYGISFNSGGTKLYALATGSNIVYQWTLSTAWDISTATADGVSIDLTSQDSSILGISYINGCLYAAGNTNDAVYKYTLSSPDNISTATLSESFSFSAETSIAREVYAKSDDTVVFMLGASSLLYEYSTVSYTQTLDLSTGTYFSFTPSGVTTVSFTNPPASGLAIGFAVEINGDGSVITWPASVKWHEATAPTATATKEIYTFITTDGGTTYYGRKAGEDMQ